jgi:hypothetical protein
VPQDAGIVNDHATGTDLLEVPTIFKGLFFKAKFQGISTKYGQKFGTAPEIPIDHGAYPLRDMNGI